MKFGYIMLFFLMNRRMCVYYIIFCVIVWVIVKYPKYERQNKMVRLRAVD